MKIKTALQHLKKHCLRAQPLLGQGLQQFFLQPLTALPARAKQKRLQLLGLVLWLGVGAVQASAQSLTAQADRTNITINETLTLTVRFEGGQPQSEPNFSPLSGQFDILSRQQSSQHSVVNGTVSTSTQWILMLAAKNSGQILIPPFELEGQTSRPITINVTTPAPKPGDTSITDDVFVEVSTDKNTVFINEQFLLTFTLYFNKSIDSLDKPPFELPNARIEELKRVDYQKTINNKRYGVAEYRYVVFPDSTIDIDIPKQTWTVRTSETPNAGRFSVRRGHTKLYRAKTQALTVKVKPKPDSYPANASWLPAKEVTIRDNWSRSPEQLKVGEPITWTITIDANGVSSEQLPPILEGLVPNGFKAYPDQPNHETQLTADGIIGRRVESVAIVPNEAGELNIPAIELSWWDTEENTVKTAKLPAKTITVKGALTNNGSNSFAPQADASAEPGAIELIGAEAVYKGPSYWYWLLVTFLLLGNVGFAYCWWQLKSKQPAQAKPHNLAGEKPSSSVKQLIALCDRGDAKALRAGLLQWGRAKWPNGQTMSLRELAAKAEDPSFSTALQHLEGSIYGGTQTQVNYEDIKNGLKLIQKATQSEQPKQGLQPLYAA